MPRLNKAGKQLLANMRLGVVLWFLNGVLVGLLLAVIVIQVMEGR